MIEIHNVEKVFGTTRGHFKSGGTIWQGAQLSDVVDVSNVTEISEVCA